MTLRLLPAAMLIVSFPAAAQESIGNGNWSLTKEKILISQKDIPQKGENQAWFYPRKDYANFDLEFDWWLGVVRDLFAVDKHGDPARSLTGPIVVMFRNLRIHQIP